MFEAQYLFAGSGGATFQVFSPWMSRQADNAIFSLEAVAVGLAEGSGIVTGAGIYHKNRDETGPGALYNVGGVTLRLTGVGTDTEVFTGLKELVRYGFYCAGDASDIYSLIRVLPPVWFDDVKA